MGLIREASGGLIIPIQVQPKSSRNEMACIQEGTLKIKVTAAPVDGKANEECISLLSGALHVRKTDITILKGHTVRRKIVFIQGVSLKDLEAALSGMKNSPRRIS
jgi:uncharacterized protein (TIGR00251 family)